MTSQVYMASKVSRLVTSNHATCWSITGKPTYKLFQYTILILSWWTRTGTAHTRHWCTQKTRNIKLCFGREKATHLPMKSTKVQTLDPRHTVQLIHKCGTSTIDGHQKEQHVMYYLFPWINGAHFCLRAKIYKVEKLPTFHLSIDFRITRGLFSAKTQGWNKSLKKRPALHLSRQTSTDAVLCRTIRCPLRNMGQW